MGLLTLYKSFISLWGGREKLSGRSICKLKTLLVRVYEQESNPATEPEERAVFVMEEDTRLASLTWPVIAQGAGVPNFSSYHGAQT